MTQGRIAPDLGRSDWADWFRSSELLFARKGRLYRILVDGKSELATREELIDLREAAGGLVPRLFHVSH
jgi:hypothetical protein